MSEAESRLPGPERLRGAENYHTWKSRVYNILEGKGLEDYIEPTCVKPEPIKVSQTPSPSTSSLPLEPSTAETAMQTAQLAEIKA